MPIARFAHRNGKQKLLAWRLAALSVAQGVARAQSPNAGAGITVVGVDGADLTARYLRDYLSVARHRLAILREYH